MYLPLNLSITSCDTPQLFNKQDTSSIFSILTIFYAEKYHTEKTHRGHNAIAETGLRTHTQNTLKQLWIKCSGLRAENI